MLVPLKWLAEFVDHGLSTAELAEALTMAGLEVDAVIERHAGLNQVKVARVLKVEPHPNADRLRLATVDYGAGEPATVVCGAPNLAEGMVSALALPGAVLAGDVKVSKAKIRGVKSLGMLGSEKELGLSLDHSGIVNLPPDLKVGDSLLTALNLETVVLELGITPNRGDCLSILGVAREVAAITGRPLTMVPTDPPETGGPIEDQTVIEIVDPHGCPRYAARLVRDVKLAPSPIWMADRLMACGVRPISNVVDITNYVLMEVGQPLHAFDFDTLHDHRILVRPATEGERFTTLDGQERTLSQGMLLICDGKEPVGLAGVMGGLNSEIADSTKHVLIESAHFDPMNTRRTSKRLGLSTEASFRFERGVDPTGCGLAADRSALLLAELAQGQVAAGLMDVHPKPYQPLRLALSAARTNRYLGIEVSRERMAGCLTALGLTVSQSPDGDGLEVEVPGHRPDLERPVDLTEEVARLVGYQNVPVSNPEGPLEAPPRERSQALREKMRDLMAAQGYDEAINYSFGHPTAPDSMNLAQGDPRRSLVALINPLSEDLAVLRSSLLPGLLRSVRRNLGHRVADVALFEVGKVFLAVPGEELPEEPMRLAAVLAGLAQPSSWHGGERPVSLAHARGAVEFLLEGLGYSGVSFSPQGQCPPYLDPGEWLEVKLGDQRLGELGRVNAKTAAAYDVDQAVYYLELDFDLLVAASPARPVFQPLPRYPGVTRDVALVMDDSVPAGEVVAAVWEQGESRLRSVDIFDVYRGKPLDKSQKSLGLRLFYRDDERTLTEQEIIPVHEAIVAKVMKKFKATLRG